MTRSILEGNGADSGIAIGRIHAVDAEKRTCTVRTFMGDEKFLDRYVEGVQWLYMDAHPAGDECTSVPRPGAMGLVFFVSGQAFIGLYIKPYTKQASTTTIDPVTGKEVGGLKQGDKIFSTPNGNYILIKANGVIELRSKETLKRIMMPLNSGIVDLCRNYSLKADGGTIDWKNLDDQLSSTLYSAEFRANLARTSVVIEERGAIDSTTIARTLIGPGLLGLPGCKTPVYEHITKITGETELKIHGPGIPGGFYATALPTGEFHIATGLAPVNQFAMDVGADGTTSIAVNKTGIVTIDKVGAIKAENKLGSVALSEKGDVELKNQVGTISMSATGKFSVKGAAAELLDLFDQHLEQQLNILAALAALTVGTGTGPSSVPLNAADFMKATTGVTKIKTLLGSIKG